MTKKPFGGRGLAALLSAFLLAAFCLGLLIVPWDGVGTAEEMETPGTLEPVGTREPAEITVDRSLAEGGGSGTEGAIVVKFLAVGQAEAIFIDDGTTEILLDGGEEEAAKHVIEVLKPLVDGPLDLVIATHAHDDHIGGLPEILDAFSVGRIIDNGRHSELESYLNYRMALEKKARTGTAYQTAKNEIFDLGGGASLHLIEMERKPQDPNETSIVCLLSCGGTRLLLMSDLDTVVERSNLERFTDVDILKVGHHGSRTATSDEFLEIVHPEAAVITAGKNNRFGLPSREVIRKLMEEGVQVYGTFRSGDITLTIPRHPQPDGPAYRFDTERTLNLFDAGAKELRKTSAGGISGAAVTGPGISDPAIPGVLSDDSGLVEAKDAVYVGNRETKKFHTMACAAGARIADRNAVYFRTRVQAVNAGYRPCGDCRP